MPATRADSCSLTSVKPSEENVIPVTKYLQTEPVIDGSLPSDFESLPLLYGGGRNFVFGLLEPECQQRTQEAELFILNSCVVIWLSAWNQGIRIPYLRILYHAVKKPDHAGDRSLELVLSVERDAVLDELFALLRAAQQRSDAIASVELVLRPKYSNHDRHYNESVDRLFSFAYFGLNRGDTMIVNCNTAIATCMDFYVPEDDDDDKDDTDTANPATPAGIAHLVNHPAAYAHIAATDQTDGNATADDSHDPIALHHRHY